MSIEPEFMERFERQQSRGLITRGRFDNSFHRRHECLVSPMILTPARFWKLKIKITQKMNVTDSMKRIGKHLSDRFYSIFLSQNRWLCR
jgi:hypothetical protein